MKHRTIALFFFIFVLVIPMNSYTAQQYIDDVMAGRQLVCKWTRLAVERHLNDLKRVEKGDPAFPYYFDEAQAKRVIDFKQELRHTKGEWRTRVSMIPGSGSSPGSSSRTGCSSGGAAKEGTDASQKHTLKLHERMVRRPTLLLQPITVISWTDQRR